MAERVADNKRLVAETEFIMQTQRRETYRHPHILLFITAVFFLIFLLAASAIVMIVSPGKMKDSQKTSADTIFEELIDDPLPRTTETPQVQGAKTERASYGMACIKSVMCTDAEDGRCLAELKKEGTQTYFVPDISRYTADLSVDDSGKPEQLYLAECTVTGETYSCTTGNPTSDTVLFGANTAPSESYSLTVYSLKGTELTALKAPITATTGNSSLYLVSSDMRPRNERFIALMYPRSIGEAFSTQEGNECSIHEDRGPQAFDSHTLEPLTATVRVLPTDPSDASVLGVEYILSAEQEGYTAFTRNDTVFPAATVMYDRIYSVNEPVQLKNIDTYAIPLKPLNLKSSEQLALKQKVLLIHYLQYYSDTEYVITGKVSHPKARIVISSQIPNKRVEGAVVKRRTLATVTADKYGVFEARVRKSILNKNEVVGELSLSKQHIRGAEQVDPTVVDIPALLPEISGKAVDTNGRTIPGAKVRISFPFSENPVYESVADEAGMFAIDASHLPSFPYKITFVTLTGERIHVNPDTFFAMQYSQNTRIASNTQGSKAVLGATDSLSNDLVIILVAAVSCFVGFLVVLSIILSSSQLKKLHR